MIYLALTALILGLSSIGVDTEEVPMPTSEDTILYLLSLVGFTLFFYLITKGKTE